MDLPNLPIACPPEPPPPQARTPRRSLQDFAWTASIVLPCALVAVLTTRLLGPLSLFWPANAVLLGMLLRHPERASAAGWLGALAAYLAADLIAGTPLPVNLGLNAANLTGVVAGYLLALRKLPADAFRLAQPRAIWPLLAICVAAAGAASLVGGWASALLFGRGVPAGVADWFNGELAYYITLLPMMLSAPRDRPVRGLLAKALRPRRWQRREALPVAALAASLAGAILVGGPGVLALPVPALIWCALRYEVFPTLVLTALLSVAQLFAIAAGLMALPEGNLLYIDSTQSARLGIALVALGPMAVAIVNGARNDLLRRLDHLARHDHLTGTLRRGAFLERASATLARLAAAGRPAAVLMIDVDHFKRINDRYGHAQGDRVLAAVAAELSAGLRGGAILGRIGGEEFAALLPDAGPPHARIVAERLRQRVAALSLPAEGTPEGTASPPEGITASFGLATCGGGGARPQALEALLARADAALYAAKAAGRNRVDTATDTDTEESPDA